METLINFVDGKKTYLVALAVGVVAGLQYLAVLDAVVAETLYGLLGASGLATLRHGISKKK